MTISGSLDVVHRLARGLGSRFRNVLYSALGVDLRGYVWMRRIEIPRNWSDITLEHDVALDTGTVLLCSGPRLASKLLIRSGSYINRYCILDAHHHLEIGRDCMIGPYCYITDADHGTEPHTTVKLQPMRTAPVFIGDGVWLGARVTVLAGVRIGNGAVIGAGSVVTREIPADAVAVGAPASVIKFRTGAQAASSASKSKD